MSALKTASRTLGITALLLATLAAVPFAEARDLRRDYDDGEVITAFSRFGNGQISGPVRPARYGYEVRLPGGTWIGCRRNCEETLRVETVDRDEGNARDIGSGGLLNECGFFGCLDAGVRF